MSQELNKKLPNNVFWDFSINIYQHPKVEQALLECQQRYGFNVNFILYFLWRGVNAQGGLSQLKIRSILKVVAPWHYKVVLPLRRLRNRLKNTGDAALKELRSEILKEELHAEHIEQLLIYDQIWHFKQRVKSPVQKINDISRSVSSYCHVLQVKADVELSQLIAKLLIALFPKLSEAEIVLICSQRLDQHPEMMKVVGTQLWLDV